LFVRQAEDGRIRFCNGSGEARFLIQQLLPAKNITAPQGSLGLKLPVFLPEDLDRAIKNYVKRCGRSPLNVNFFIASVMMFAKLGGSGEQLFISDAKEQMDFF
jgi:hypothetical protein